MNGDSHTLESGSGVEENESLSRLKRTACVICRKRKLKCDGGRPKCQTCDRLGHDCKYDEVRKKSGPKRGYVKVLEARLAQVETQLKKGNAAPDTADNSATDTSPGCLFSATDPSSLISQTGCGPIPGAVYPEGPGAVDGFSNYNSQQAFTMPNFLGAMDGLGDSVPQMEEPMMFEEQGSWDMISLGLEEPLPTHELATELTEIYFEKIHPSIPILHRGRFFANMHLAPKARPPVCLRYAMWTLAAGVSDKYGQMIEHFYRRSRKYLELDEMHGFGERIITIAHCQTWIMMSLFEFQNMHFPRAWMSTGRAVRLAQMLSLHRVDGVGLDVKQCLPHPKDWADKEERRRTFWMCFWEDRCSSIGTGWPMTIEEQDIMTKLPSSEEAFQTSTPQSTCTLAEALDGKSSELHGFSGALLLSALFGRNLTHLHRPGPNDNEHDLNGDFWERHRKLDNILLNINLTLPDHLRIPSGLPDPNVIFMNMCIHTSVICLHQAAIFKSDKYRLAANVSGESKMRCLTAASEIASIMRSIAHLDLSTMNPFMAFCLYVSARVFVQVLKARRNDRQIKGSLEFLLLAMHILKVRNALTESFIAQLDLDMESAGLPNPRPQGSLSAMLEKRVPMYPRSAHCGDKGFSGARKDIKFSENSTEGYHSGLIQDIKKSGLSNPNREASSQPIYQVSADVSNDAMGRRIWNDDRLRTDSTASSERELPTRYAEPPGMQHIRRNNPWQFDGMPTQTGCPGILNTDGDFRGRTPAAVEIDMSPETTNIDQPSRNNSYRQTPENSNSNSTNNTNNRNSCWDPISTSISNDIPPPQRSPAVYAFSQLRNNLSSTTTTTTNNTSPYSQNSLNSNFNPVSPPGINEQDFNVMANQLFPPTPGIEQTTKMAENWDWTHTGTGMTPDANVVLQGEDWAQAMEFMDWGDPNAIPHTPAPVWHRPGASEE